MKTESCHAFVSTQLGLQTEQQLKEQEFSEQSNRTTENFFLNDEEMFENSSLLCLSKDNKFRIAIQSLVSKKAFKIVIDIIIIVNCIVLIFDTIDSLKQFTTYSNICFITIFSVECLLKVIAYGFILGQHSYLRDPWNWLDFIVVVTGLISFVPSISADLRALRTFRLIRPLKTISMLPHMRLFIETLVDSLFDLGTVFLLMIFFFLIFAILGLSIWTERFEYLCRTELSPSKGLLPIDHNYSKHLCGGQNDCGGRPEYCLSSQEISRNKVYFFSKAYHYNNELYSKEFNYGLTNFNNILNSLFIIFVVTTLEGWSHIMFMMMDGHNYYLAMIYFVLCVIINYYFMLNLIVAVLLYNFSRARTRTRDLKLSIDSSRKRKNDLNNIQIHVTIENLGEEAIRKKYRGKYEMIIRKQRKKSEVRKLLNYIYSFRKFKCFKRVKRQSEYHKKYYLGYLCYLVIQQPAVQFFFHGLIILNAILLSIDRVDISQTEKNLIQVINYFFVACFALEQFLNINGHGKDYFQNGLRIMGLFIVLSSIIELILKANGIVFTKSAASLISSFRMFRMLRFLTLFRGWQSFQIILESIFAAIARMIDFIFLFLVFLYMYALLGYNFFNNSMKYSSSGRFSASQPSTDSNFNNFPQSLVSVFLIIIGDHWQVLFFDAYRSDKSNSIVTIIYFVTLILFGHITLMNIFLAYIIDSFENAKKHIEKNVNIRNFIYEMIFLYNERTQNIQHKLYFKLIRKNKIDFIENKVIDKLIVNKYTGNCNSIYDDKHKKRQKTNKIKEMILTKKIDQHYEDIQFEFHEFHIKYDMKRQIRKCGRKMTMIPYKKRLDFEDDHHIESMIGFSKSRKKTFKRFDSHFDMFNNIKHLNFNDNQLKDTKEETDLSISAKNPSNDKIDLKRIFDNTTMIKPLKKRSKTYNHMMNSSLFIFHKDWKMCKFLKVKIAHDIFTYIIMTLIVIDCICLCLDTPYLDRNSAGGMTIRVIDDITNYAFLIEAILRIIVMGFICNEGAYMRDLFNIIDFTCVIISILDFFGVLRKYQFLRTIKSIRCLKPIQIITKSENLLLITNCLLRSLPAMSSLLLFSAILILLFAVVGIGLMKGELFYYCTLIIFKNKEVCINAGGYWFHYQNNYSNFLLSLKSNFIVMTSENWSRLMYFAYEKENTNLLIYFFFILQVIVTHVFISNLLVALMIQKFKSLKTKRHKSYLLNDSEKEWVHVQKMLSLFHPRPLISEDKLSEGMQRFARFVNDPWFEIIIGIIISLSGILLLMQYSGASDEYNRILEYCNLVFTLLFNVEIVFKVIVLRKSYFYSSWNKFDFIVIIICDCFGIGYILTIADVIKIKALSVIPITLRLFRILRVIRVLSTFGKLRALIDSLVYLIPSIGNIGLIIFIFILIYANIGMHMFGTVPYREAITPNNNFRTFLSSSLLLFLSMTGENWNNVMNEIAYHDCRNPKSNEYQEDYYCMTYKSICFDQEYINYTSLNELEMYSCGSDFSYVYFISFMIIGPMFMMNLCIVMVIEGFSEAMSQNENLLPQDYLQKFISVWMNYDQDCKKLICPHEFILILKELQPPLGLNYDGMLMANSFEQAKDRKEYLSFIDLLNQMKKELQKKEGFKRVTTIRAYTDCKYVKRIQCPQKYKFKNYYLSRNKKFHTTDTEVIKLTDTLGIIAAEDDTYQKNKYSYVFTTNNMKQKRDQEERELYIHFVDACLAISRYAVSKTQKISFKKLRRYVVNNYTKMMWAKQYDKDIIDKFFPKDDNENTNELSKKLAGQMMMRVHQFYKNSLNERKQFKRMSMMTPGLDTLNLDQIKDAFNDEVGSHDNELNDQIVEKKNTYELAPVLSCFNFKTAANLINFAKAKKKISSQTMKKEKKAKNHKDSKHDSSISKDSEENEEKNKEIIEEQENDHELYKDKEHIHDEKEDKNKEKDQENDDVTSKNSFINKRIFNFKGNDEVL